MYTFHTKLKKIIMKLYVIGSIHKTITAIASFCCLLVFLLFTQNWILTSDQVDNILFMKSEEADTQYLVSSPKCKILNLDPFDSEVLNYHERQIYQPCRDHNHDLLTYITKKNNTATLYINSSMIPTYSNTNIVCSYATVKRKSYNPEYESYNNLDNSIQESEYVPFKEHVELIDDFVSVTCKDPVSRYTVYNNVHATVTIKKHLKKRLEAFSVKTKPSSILFVGIDSVSRLNFIRSLPNSHKFLMDNDWIALKGYNKMGDNTFPNLMAILTGFDEDQANRYCLSSDNQMFDDCPFVWNDYKSANYVTAYAEDESYMSTFNCGKSGFIQEPTDYYFRPYFLRTEELTVYKIDDLKYCTGPESAGERVLNVAKDFTTTFKNSPSFGFFWMNSFSHNSLNAVSRMDNKIKKIFDDIKQEGILENSIVIFLSDHGLRCGEFRKTAMGWLEERLPFIYIWIPKTFRQQFPNQYANLKKNIDKLTSPFDLYLTLQHFLVLSGLQSTPKPSYGCQNCRSLFEEPESERSCKDAGIKQHWCSCANFSPLDPKQTKIVEKAAKFLIYQINDIVGVTGGMCVEYSLEKIVKAGIFTSYEDQKFFLLVIETQPKAVFETTLFYSKIYKDFRVKGEISRLDKYELYSQCTDDAVLKKYCHCDNSTLRFL